MRNDHTAPLEQLDDAELVAMAQSGQRAAFETLFHRHRDPIYTLVLAMLGNTSDAKDIVQETFVRAYKRLGTLQAEKGIASFLRRTARNAVIDLIRTRKVANQVSIELLRSEPEARANQNPDQRVSDAIENEKLIEAVLALPDPQRHVIVLHHVEGMKVDEISQLLGIPSGTVKSRLARGREMLRRNLFGRDEA